MKVEPLTLEQAPLSVRSFFSDTTGPLVSTMGHVPELLQVAMPMITQQFGPSALSMRHKEMVVLGVSALQGCRYCTQTHTVIAHREGLTPEELLVLRGATENVNEFVDAEASLWSYVLAVGAGTIDRSQSDRAMDLLKNDLLDFEIVEITMLIGTTIMLNRYCIALDIPTAPLHLAWLSQQDWL